MALSVVQLQRMRAAALDGGDRGRALPRPAGGGEGGATFADTLQNAVDSVDEAQKTADGQVAAFVSGEQENVHEVMLALNDAKLSFQLMTEVRNRMLETYQELMRMQV